VNPKPVLRIVSPGPLAAVQDLGRVGCQHLGIPTAGAMDPVALRIANALVGNPPAAAGLEITFGGFEAEFLTDTACGVAGANLGFELDGKPLEPGTAFLARRDTRLRAAGRRWGCRAYLALRGGVGVPEVLGSRSTYAPAGFGGLGGRPLRAGDEVPGFGGIPAEWCPYRKVPPDVVPRYPRAGEPAVLRAVPGPQAAAFTAAGLRTFFTEPCSVSPEADRMGYRLEGPRIEHAAGADIVSDGTAWGAVQVPGHGRPIVLLADRQTTGGYAKIATIATADLPLIAQAIPGDSVRFEEIDLWTAREILAWGEYRLRRWERSTAGR
jgi:antagonist of KipI